MRKRQAISLVILGVVVFVFGRIVYQRGLGWRLGAAPGVLETPYKTEEAWAIDQIVRDIVEMSAFPRQPMAEPSVTAVAPDGRYRVDLGGSNVDLDLTGQLWVPDALARVAGAALGPPQANPNPSTAAAHAVNASLLDLSASTLVTTAASISVLKAGTSKTWHSSAR